MKVKNAFSSAKVNKAFSSTTVKKHSLLKIQNENQVFQERKLIFKSNLFATKPDKATACRIVKELHKAFSSENNAMLVKVEVKVNFMKKITFQN